MAAINIVLASKLSPTRRYDAEHYQAKYIEAEEKLLQISDGVTLGRLASTVTQGFNPKFKEKGVPCINGKNVYWGTAKAGEFSFVSQQDYEIHSSFHLRPEDILITLKHATKIGRAWVIEDSLPFVFARNVGLIRLRSDSPINAASLLFYLWSELAQRTLDRIATGGTNGQITLPVTALKRLPVPVFSEVLQRELDSCLRYSLGLEKKSKGLNEKAQTQLLTALNLHDWQPPRVLTWTRDASQIVRAGRWDGEYFHPRYAAMIDRVPTSVDLVPLGRIVHLEKGIEVGGAEYREEGIPFWRVANLTTQGMDEGSVKYISPELYRLLREAYEPRQGEILLSKDGTPGLAHYLEEGIEGITSGGILRLSLKEPINPYYLEAVLNSSWVQMQVEQSAGGSIIKHWKPSEVRGTIIPRLAPDEEAAIGALVSQSHAARKSAQELLQRAKSAVEIAIENGEAAALEWLNAS